MKHEKSFTAYTHPAGGWGSVDSLGHSLTHERVPLRGSRILMHQNKPTALLAPYVSAGRQSRALITGL